MLTEIASKSAILKSFEVRSSKCKHKLIMLISQKAMQNTSIIHPLLLCCDNALLVIIKL